MIELFLKRIGDFESLIILNDRAPIEYCMTFIDYKALLEGTPVTITMANASNRQRDGPTYYAQASMRD